MAIKEGILPDYEINVITTPLDNKTLVNYGGKKKTEKTRFANYKWVVDKLEKEEKNSFHMKLKIISILQTSSSKMKATIRSYREIQGGKAACVLWKDRSGG